MKQYCNTVGGDCSGSDHGILPAYNLALRLWELFETQAPRFSPTRTWFLQPKTEWKKGLRVLSFKMTPLRKEPFSPQRRRRHRSSPGQEPPFKVSQEVSAAGG